MRTRVWLLLLTACSASSTQPHPGQACTVENTATCDPTNGQFLVCTNAAYVVLADCHGPEGCTTTNETASCDTSGNGLGDRCPPSSEGKVRCDPDGGHLILRCVDGGLSSVFECPTGSTCGVADAGLSCY